MKSHRFLIRPEGPKERIVRLRREKDSLLLLFQALKGRKKVRHRRIKSVNGYENSK